MRFIINVAKLRVNGVEAKIAGTFTLKDINLKRKRLRNWRKPSSPRARVLEAELVV